MKQYYTTSKGIIQKAGRKKKVYFNAERPYFVLNGHRQHLDEIALLSYPIMYEDENGKISPIGGYIALSNVFGLLVEVHANCESVQLWEEIEV